MKKISVLIALLLMALLLLSSCGEEKLRYNVESVTLKIEDNDRDDEFPFSNSQINEFLDVLSVIDLSQYEIDDDPIPEPGGPPMEIYINSDTEEWHLTFAVPYIAYEGNYYMAQKRLGYVEEGDVFWTLSKIADKLGAD